MTVAVCMKWLTPAGGDDRFGGVSPADESALELALRLGEARREDVLAVTLGPPAADAAVRQALACGANRAVRVSGPADLDSSDVAAALEPVVAAASFVCCGDASLDRGTGSVPAFLAAFLGARQALGLIEVHVEDGVLTGIRRLDGGRRERIRANAPAVVSVEGATAPLRRASLRGTLAARTSPIDVLTGPAVDTRPVAVRPYRPRARVLPGPAGDTALERIRDLLASAGGPVAHGDSVTLDPAVAADRILAALRDWGYGP